MIMRVVRVTVHEGQEDEFEKVLKTIVLPTIRGQADSGLIRTTMVHIEDSIPIFLSRGYNEPRSE